MGNTVALRPWGKVSEPLDFQGRSWAWLAQRAQLRMSKLLGLRRGSPHHTLHEREKRLIAEALGVPIGHIWPEGGTPEA